MLEKYLEQYVETLYKNSNKGAKKEQHGIYTKEEYYKLLKPVIELFKKDLTLEEMREELYKQSNIEENVDKFIHKREMSPGMVFRVGTKNYEETIVIGNRQEVKLDENNNITPALEEMTEDTIFDIASITKLFTSLSILKLVQNKTISLNDEITKYAPEFKNLKGVTIFDLLSFRTPLKTNGRIDRAESKEQAEEILLNIEVAEPIGNKNPYTDMGAMVLKYVIEHASGMNYYEFVKQNILDKLNMKDTHIIVPEMKLDRVASTNLGVKYFKDGNTNITTHKNGTVYDEKAQILLPKESGHAGMFSTVDDMSNLAKGIIGGQIIDEKYVRRMAKNRTGKKYIEDNQEKYVQYLGFLCYAKNPCYLDTEIFHALSGRSIASAGWTGTQLTVDPINELYFFMAGNRSHNRMTYIDPAQRNKVVTDENNKKTITLPNGKTMIDSTRYAWDRCYDIIFPALELTIQYKMLEDLYELMNEKIEKETKTRKI